MEDCLNWLKKFRIEYLLGKVIPFLEGERIFCLLKEKEYISIALSFILEGKYLSDLGIGKFIAEIFYLFDIQGTNHLL